MGDRMTPIPFGELIQWILTERKKLGTVFGIRKAFVKESEKKLSLFGETIETPFGPAAGPHTQLAQNIISAYYTGSRFFELKTVQTLDGEDLPVNKPCILADDECYNCEWSTELKVEEAYDEYVKAWFALKLLSKELKLGDPSGFIFNMSVGYDFEGIKSKKIDNFIENLKDASNTPIWEECKRYALEHLELFSSFDEEYINQISAVICTSATLSTLHGCPPQEIEKIASYLIQEKKLNTFVKCNPTLLGYDVARNIMDSMQYDYVKFGDFHFKDDLQFEDAVPMLQRLQKLAEENQLTFGVKLTNTFPVDVTRKELPSEEMYMSGRSLYALTLAVAEKLTKAFDGKLRISYSGGADAFNVDKIFEMGIWPITIATTLLKPGGYERGVQIAQILEKMEFKPFEKVDLEALKTLAKEAKTDPHYTKAIKPLPNRKMNRKVPLFDCFVAPCNEGCPINQDISTYIKLAGEGKYVDALKVIMDKNPLPFITGTICNHKCMESCTRNFYEESIKIRDVKLVAAEKGFEEVFGSYMAPPSVGDKKVAVVGGGPAGLAAAYYLAKEGISVTIFEERESLGGVVRHVIPEFRIALKDMEKDICFIEHMGVQIKLNSRVNNIEELKQMGYSHVICAIGAWKKGELDLEGTKTLNAISFLEDCKKRPEQLKLGKAVAVIGGGNTAMDAARAAKRIKGVEKVYLVYRRTKRYMPAEEEELLLALEDGVDFKELLSPVMMKDGKLICNKMILKEEDAYGRPKPYETEEQEEIIVDTVVAAVGEQIDTSIYKESGLKTDDKGRVVVHPTTLESSQKAVYVIGDGLNGPATVVEAIRDAGKAVRDILEKEADAPVEPESTVESTLAKKGVLVHSSEEQAEDKRCLVCDLVCECCVDVCPNRANITIPMKGESMPAIIHVDRMCNECGNCKSFCPYDSAPYKEKITLFHTKEDFMNSENEGFLTLDVDKMLFLIRLGGKVEEVSLLDSPDLVDEKMKNLLTTITKEHFYL